MDIRSGCAAATGWLAFIVLSASKWICMRNLKAGQSVLYGAIAASRVGTGYFSTSAVLLVLDCGVLMVPYNQSQIGKVILKFCVVISAVSWCIVCNRRR